MMCNVEKYVDVIVDEIIEKFSDETSYREITGERYRKKFEESFL